ncbi:redoxin domain-containing protein [Danxiaibacter flavus]|uniref:Redoxin domain-containing protein n=1 Tax=Danxiaibacter flavus TaxID=3049108 RepID=A0ABV3ZC27_9BACT|nr:redoxin domain-containing protein [Chitinophagaceae bacterium DXS]
MNKYAFILLFSLLAINTFSQKNDTLPGFKKNPNIPAFKIMQSDSSWFTKADLPKNQTVLFVYFNPECGHCQLTADAFSKKMDELKDVFMVWVTYHATPAQIQKFADDFNLSQYSNIRFGRDPQYFIPSFFEVKFTPFMAVYDKKGKFFQSYPEGTDPDTLEKLVHKH